MQPADSQYVNDAAVGERLLQLRVQPASVAQKQGLQQILRFCAEAGCREYIRDRIAQSHEKHRHAVPEAKRLQAVGVAVGHERIAVVRQIGRIVERARVGRAFQCRQSGLNMNLVARPLRKPYRQRQQPFAHIKHAVARDYRVSLNLVFYSVVVDADHRLDAAINIDLSVGPDQLHRPQLLPLIPERHEKQEDDPACPVPIRRPEADAHDYHPDQAQHADDVKDTLEARQEYGQKNTAQHADKDTSER